MNILLNQTFVAAVESPAQTSPPQPLFQTSPPPSTLLQTSRSADEAEDNDPTDFAGLLAASVAFTHAPSNVALTANILVTDESSAVVSSAVVSVISPFTAHLDKPQAAVDLNALTQSVPPPQIDNAATSTNNAAITSLQTFDIAASLNDATATTANHQNESSIYRRQDFQAATDIEFQSRTATERADAVISAAVVPQQNQRGIAPLSAQVSITSRSANPATNLATNLAIDLGVNLTIETQSKTAMKNGLSALLPVALNNLPIFVPPGFGLNALTKRQFEFRAPFAIGSEKAQFETSEITNFARIKSVIAEAVSANQNQDSGLPLAPVKTLAQIFVGDDLALSNVVALNPDLITKDLMSNKDLAKENEALTFSDAAFDETATVGNHQLSIDSSALAPTYNSSLDSTPEALIKQTVAPLIALAESLMKNEMRTLRVHLQPEQFGRLSINVTRDGSGNIAAALYTESTAAQTALSSHINQLRETLQQANLRLQHLSINVSENLATAENHAAHQHHHHQQQSSTQSYESQPATASRRDLNPKPVSSGDSSPLNSSSRNKFLSSDKFLSLQA